MGTACLQRLTARHKTRNGSSLFLDMHNIKKKQQPTNHPITVEELIKRALADIPEQGFAAAAGVQCN